ncbi:MULTISPECIES: LysM peptidoglycan-binding domain-containing protein [Vibrio]|uniref:N-acetylmuramoyl-L-alanine amidase n=3 Tax=Vibrio cyclitrophicus TaxID=47951 RepID=A0A7Z1MGX7_9VIBR|nr:MULTISPECIES: LysM peptidoglycan-binding domain-containing protein [Vibrio]MBY7663217.1 N-acetylmuramoyl-L-alanine amidase [Vibrio atlanticus]ERM59266.1 N-acetylmuramoyl-L-alanine amidase [Vibrio cyclitrophicus FF75]MBE8607972.1 N-acetylmuramoyl-L-alanine amidase [Vibrio sp. OPT10]MBU2933480.1 N-acetylmuramoyl-L-alanine amidase [Vibrio cyclitrophicus]MCC4775021.1 N-acetylmuramoyl-L-alanine amidase [Vibrio cyclitrophicus]|tara:strand:+ start:697 stop:2418 length:1722 start_codon:yes stop_codon:yes gene_type:complete
MLISKRLFSTAAMMAAVFSLLFSSLVSANSLKSLRVWPSPEETRVVIDLKSEADFSYFTLSSPSRLVVDLKNTNLATKLPVVVKDSPVLSKIRKSSPPDKSTYRLVFELKKSSKAELFKLSPTPGGQYGHRLVIDLPHGAASKGTTTSTPSKPTVSKDINQVKRQKDILIVIDPGHGGEDPGSIGPSRKYEKNATLSISKKLAAQLNAVPGIKTRLTRNADYFVNLNRRVAIARENEAHLLISIHADAFTTPQPRGGSVFVLNTRRANTEISRWIENKEKQSELLGGSGAAFTGNIDDKNVNQTLLDLQFSHSQKEGYKLATAILSEMGKVAKLHNSKPINTSLAVLRSPQIPSVLVETGFISNPTEEKLLFQRSHQDKLARAVTKAVVKYLKANPPEGIILSNATSSTGSVSQHKVSRGESLSVIASKYGTSTQALMKLNNLKSSSLAIGQVLKIPSSAQGSSSSSAVKTKTITHTVKSGEYLGKIASRYKVLVADIKRENRLKSETLRVGQKLRITVEVKDIPLRKHKVARGDYLGKIASKYGVSVDAIRKANNLRSDSLAVGQVLIIPHK